jgi:hypothetical protein
MACMYSKEIVAFIIANHSIHSSFTYMSCFNLAYGQFSSIPTEIGNLKGLQRLDLGEYMVLD